MGLSAKLWGVRGSLPTPQAPGEIASRIEELFHGFFDAGHVTREEVGSYLASLPSERVGGFGGNTVCCEVYSDSTSLIIDGGSGIRAKGNQLLGGACARGEGEVHILMTHLHWDHLIGLPFFSPLFISGNTINFYAVQPEMEETLRTVFRKPNFPVPFDALPATVVVHRLEPRQSLRIGDIDFTPYRLDHPDPCWGYRVEHQGRALAYCVDTECTRSTIEAMGEDRPLYHNAHTMFFDAQYTLSESIEKANWGHAAATIGLDVALREGIGKVVFMHHDPAASDLAIARARRQTEDYYRFACRSIASTQGWTPHVEWLFADEGMIVPI